ncbi:MAG TPA: hypothetical protein ENK82_07350 [Campylobacterales bacterium]|nr:hypothetical protein [Campylobacterales bacterium]
MNIKIIEKALLPLFIAAVLIVAFNWQFINSYAYILEHFKDEKLSVQIAHLFIYSFLALALSLFLINTLNILIKSKLFIATSIVTLFAFYLLSYEAFISHINYFIDYPLTANALMFMILYVISILVYALYSLVMPFLNDGKLPFIHSLIFLLIAITYSLWFIDNQAYPLSTLYEKYVQLGLKA